jgi:uncharacterized BrkB/YihY/UPF0761 family membrane protein
MGIIWQVERKPGLGIMATVRDRALSFGMVAVIGLLLLASLIISAVISAFNAYFSDLLPGSEFLWQSANVIASLLLITLLFAMMYKVLPDVKIAWRDVWLGAAVTSALFVVGKQLLGFYLGRQSFDSTYGAAGSLVLLLVWVYYSAQIFFFGAEFTQIYASRYGQGMRLKENAQFASSRGAENPYRPAAPDQGATTRVAPSEAAASIAVAKPAGTITAQPQEKSNLWLSALVTAALTAVLFIRGRRDSAK